ncbi:MAG: HAD family phosphatase [Caldilineales bacterium]|nr:HAD family phosphatase [Caldilineales bacterium]
MPIRLAIFDVDGVIKESPDPYTYLHKCFGTETAGARYLAAFLAGEISYEQFADLDAGEWRGRSVAETKAALRANPYVPGAFETAAGLRERDIPLILLSSGFDLHVEDVAAELNAAEFHCNGLDHDGERLLGTMTVYVPWGGKGPIVRSLLSQWKIDPAQCLAVGDTGSDIDMFREVGHAVAIRPARPEVSQAAHLTLPNLTGLLSYLDTIL